jgi:GDP-4-dehydro-6-deoxy-D-mannose reductase
MTKTIWITGVSGFTGKYLAKYLQNIPEKMKIVGLGRSNETEAETDIHYKIDLNNINAITEITRFDPPDYIFHLAGAMPPVDESEMWLANVGCTVNLFRGLYKGNCLEPTIVIIGSAAEYMMSSTGLLTETSPCGGETVYGRTKWAQTSLAIQLGEQLNFKVKVARPFNLIGPELPRRLVAGELCAQFANQDVKTLLIGNTRSERDFIDVRDAVSAYWKIALDGNNGEIYNVCSGKPTSIEALLSLFALSSEAPKKYTIDSNRLRSVDLDCVYGSLEKTQKETGWKPMYSLEDSVKDMLGNISS